MERLSPDVVQKFKKKKRRLRLSIIACVAVVVVALSTLVIYTSTIQSGVKISEKNTIVIDKDNVPPDIEDAKSYIENRATLKIITIKRRFLNDESC